VSKIELEGEGAVHVDQAPKAPPDRAITPTVEPTPGRDTSSRAIAVWVLIVLSCSLVVLATIAVGVQQVLLNTDRWTAAVGPLATNPTVQSSVADTAAALALNALDVPGRVASLPAPLRGLSGSVEAALATFVDDQALRLVQSPRFPELWVGLNQTLHPALVQMLRGQPPSGGAITVVNGEVQVNTSVLVAALLERVGQLAPDMLDGQLPAGVINGATPPNELQQRVVGALGRQLPPEFGYVSVMQASSLATAQRAVQTLDSVTWLLLVAGLISTVVTLVVSVDRRLTTLRLGIGVALGMLVAGVGLIWVQNMLVSSVAGYPISGAAQAAIAAVFGSLGQFMVTVGVVAAIVALVAYVAGRREWATMFHRGTQPT
jgi:hypothetical protein